MSVEFSCRECGRTLRVNKSAIGRRIRCPDCATLLTVPERADSADDVIDDLEILPDEELEPEAAEPPPLIEPPVVAPPRIASPRRPAARHSDQPVEAPVSAESDAILLPPHRPHPDDLIDMTAMVDIVFFLLIFFLVTSLQALEAVMNLPPPQSAGAGASAGRTTAELENDPNFITVRIEDDDSIWVEDIQVFNDQDLNVRLRAARRAADGPRSLLVVGDADASHGAAVRVFDAGAGAGVNGISLIVQEKSESSK